MADITKTRDELVQMIGEELFVISAGHALEDEDAVKIGGRLDVLLSELASRGVVYVADDNAIPAEWCGALAELGANECAPTFSKQKMAPDARESIEQRLKVMVQRTSAPNRYLKSDTALLGGPHYTYERWRSGG